MYHFNTTNDVLVSIMTLNSNSLGAFMVVFIKDKTSKTQVNNFRYIGQVMQKK